MQPPNGPAHRAALELTPIGVVHSPFRERGEAPRQPRAAEGVVGRIELHPGHGYEDALDGLEGWSRIWVLFWFDRNAEWRPKVRPPRSHRKRGVFATRSPHRPNPIGLSVLRLDRVEGRSLHVRDVDLLDGTPVLDIKPYVAWTDAVPDADAGWLASDPGPQFEVLFSEEAVERLAFLGRTGEGLRRRIREVLSAGPQPHAYRRIKRNGEGYRLAVKEWRAGFIVDGNRITVTRISSGYRPAQIFGSPPVAPAEHLRFAERFGVE